MFFEIIPDGTHIDFIGRRRVAFAASGLVLLAALLAGLVEGVHMGIDFAGGTEVQVRFEQDGVEEGDIRGVVGACGVADPSVVRYGETDVPEFLIRFRASRAIVPHEEGVADCPLTEEQKAQLAAVDRATGAEAGEGDTGALVDRLTLALGNAIGPLEVERIEYVGPRVGDELRRDGLSAILIACLLVLVYIAFRFSTRFAPGAVIALMHDVLVTAGTFVIFGLEFDLTVLAALLAIMGYSLNDTIIIYDRIRENMERRTKTDLVEVLNLSVNQTLSRTLLTSGTTMGAVLVLLIVGGEVIRSFALAMCIGIVVGTYSSVFIAAPTLLFLEMRFGGGGETGQKPRTREVEARANSRNAGGRSRNKARGRRASGRG